MPPPIPETEPAEACPALVRLLDVGGFGEVWLGRDAAGGLKAVKRIPAHARRALAREEEALLAYQRSRHLLQCPSLLPIEAVHRTGDALSYVMPLGDGTGAAHPEDPGWRPLTLAEVTEQRRSEARWFSTQQIRELLLPVVDAVMALGSAGLVHRDIKPSNILFRNGAPCLADFGLLHADSPTISAIGTPGFFAPSWYVETGGHPDIWGLACVLYTLLSGNAPDKLGRAAYRWPPQGEASLSGEARQEWLGFHRILQRATHEKPAERYLRLEDFRAALLACGCSSPGAPSPRAPGKWQHRKALLVALPAAVALFFFTLRHGARPPEAAGPTATPPGSGLPSSEPATIPSGAPGAPDREALADPVSKTDPVALEALEQAAYGAMRDMERSLVLLPNGRGLDPVNWPEIAALGRRISLGEIPRGTMETEVQRALEPADHAIGDFLEKGGNDPEVLKRHRILVQARNDVAVWVRFFFCSLIPPEPVRRSRFVR